MFEYIRSLLAEIVPQQPKPRRFSRRRMPDKREADQRTEDERRPASFGKRGGERPAGGRSERQSGGRS